MLLDINTMYGCRQFIRIVQEQIRIGDVCTACACDVDGIAAFKILEDILDRKHAETASFPVCQWSSFVG
jgi:hypothetical protein